MVFLNPEIDIGYANFKAYLRKIITIRDMLLLQQKTVDLKAEFNNRIFVVNNTTTMNDAENMYEILTIV